MTLQAQLGPATAVADDPSASHAGRWHVLAILSALMGFASISTDFYLPAMPAMAAELGANEGSVAYTISGFLIGFSLGQLLWGAVSDKYGRRLPVAIGLVLFVIGSIGCATSLSVEAIILWRVLQALGACAGVVLSRAMVRDLYQGPRAAQMLSTLIAVMAIAPLLGPILGSQIAAVAGWRAIFWALVLLGLLALAGLFTLPETLPAARRRTDPLTGAFRRYADLLKQRKILGHAGAGAFFYSGIYAYIAGTPSAFITHHRVPAEYYGLLFGAGIIGIVITNLINARLVHRFGIGRILSAGTLVAMIAGIAVAVSAYADLGGLWGLFAPLLIFVSATGFIVANSIAGAMADEPGQAGAVSALVGAIQYGSGIAGSGLVGLFADGTPWPMGWVIALMGIGSAACARVVTSTGPGPRQGDPPVRSGPLPEQRLPTPTNT